jgi:hypothetical protein
MGMSGMAARSRSFARGLPVRRSSLVSPFLGASAASQRLGPAQLDRATRSSVDAQRILAFDLHAVAATATRTIAEVPFKAATKS